MADRLIYLIYRIVHWGLAQLPMTLAFRLGMAAGWLAYWVVVPYRKIALGNLAIAFGGQNLAANRRLARRHFTLLGGNLLSSIRLSTLPVDEIRKCVEVIHPERLEQIHERGTILAISHMGNWELIAQISPLLFPGRCGTIYQRLSNPHLEAHIRSARARQGLMLFERQEGFGKIVNLLRSGGGIGILIDQHAGDKGVWCPFFDRLASTSPLVATLARRTGAVILPAALETLRPGKWRLTLEPLIEPGREDIATVTARTNQSLEAQIRRSPADWFWVHNRWKLPKPNLLLSCYKREEAYPPGYDRKRLQPLRIVVRSSNWLGDAVMTTPAFQAIRAGRPDLYVAVLVKEKLAGYWQNVEGVDEVIPILADDTLFSVARKLKEKKFEAAVIFPNSIRTGLEAWLAGIPRRIGYPTSGRQWLINQPVLAPRKKRVIPPHQVFHYLEIARQMGAEIGEATGPTAFFTPPPVRVGEGRSLRLQARREQPFRIGICPGAEYGAAKRWFPQRFAECANTVSLPAEWVLFGVKGDAPVGAAIEAAFCPDATRAMTNLIGKTSLQELMEELSNCDLLLSNDTGTMHLAAALGVPSVAIFGSTEPVLTAPLGPDHTILRHQVECSPCFLRECPIDFRCMEAVTVAEAVAAIETYLQQCRSE